MKQYPSIYRDVANYPAYVFDKLDGSNLRFEYTKKYGFSKYGTRSRLFDESDQVFGCAISIFKNTLQDNLTKYIKDNRLDKIIVFCEFYGKNSFAGCHDSQDTKNLDLIDICIYKKDFLSPKDYLKVVEKYKLNSAKYLGYFGWNQDLVNLVYENKLKGVSFEGIVGKAYLDGEYIRSKAKTKQWIDKVRLLKAEQAEEIINS